MQGHRIYKKGAGTAVLRKHHITLTALAEELEVSLATAHRIVNVPGYLHMKALKVAVVKLGGPAAWVDMAARMKEVTP